MYDVFAKKQRFSQALSILCGSGPLCLCLVNWQDLKKKISSNIFAQHTYMKLISADGKSFVKYMLTNGACDYHVSVMLPCSDRTARCGCCDG